MENRQVTIRSASAFDIPDMADLLAGLFEIEKDFSADFKKQETGLGLLFSDSDRARVLVAEKDERIIGMATAQLVVSTAEGALSALVEDVVVAASERGGGTGTMLLNALSDWAVKRKATRMQLLADRTNQAALGFYRRLGWSETGMIALRMTAMPMDGR